MFQDAECIFFQIASLLKGLRLVLPAVLFFWLWRFFVSAVLFGAAFALCFGAAFAFPAPRGFLALALGFDATALACLAGRFFAARSSPSSPWSPSPWSPWLWPGGLLAASLIDCLSSQAGTMWVLFITCNVTEHRMIIDEWKKITLCLSKNYTLDPNQYNSHMTVLATSSSPELAELCLWEMDLLRVHFESIDHGCSHGRWDCQSPDRTWSKHHQIESVETTCHYLSLFWCRFHASCSMSSPTKAESGSWLSRRSCGA